MARKRFYHRQITTSGNKYAIGYKFWMTAKNPLPEKYWINKGEMAFYNLDYENIDDLMIMCDCILINPYVCRYHGIMGFLPSAIIKEVIPELPMNGVGLPQKNNIYYRYDGKNGNGKVSGINLPMYGGKYGSITGTTNLAFNLFLSNYITPTDEDDPATSMFGFKYQNGEFSDVSNNYKVSHIIDLDFPNANTATSILVNNRQKYFDMIFERYNLDWYERVINSPFSRVKDPKLKQLVMDNILLCAGVSGQNAYHSNYLTSYYPAVFVSVSSLPYYVRGFIPSHSNPTFYYDNRFMFYGNNIPAYFHFKTGTAPNAELTESNIVKGSLIFNGLEYTVNNMPIITRGDYSYLTKLYKCLSNFYTGWAGEHKQQDFNPNSEYIYRALENDIPLQVDCPLNFTGELQVPDNSIFGNRIVNLKSTIDAFANLDIVNLKYPGLKNG